MSEEEIKLIEEIKADCIKQANYVDVKAMEKYNALRKLQQENNRLLELCMFALIRDTKIYNHALDKENKSKFIDVIRNNLNDDIYTLRRKLINVWEGNNE